VAKAAADKEKAKAETATEKAEQPAAGPSTDKEKEPGGTVADSTATSGEVVNASLTLTTTTTTNGTETTSSAVSLLTPLGTGKPVSGDDSDKSEDGDTEADKKSDPDRDIKDISEDDSIFLGLRVYSNKDAGPVTIVGALRHEMEVSAKLAL
jgi:hypothetical protein